MHTSRRVLREKFQHTRRKVDVLSLAAFAPNRGATTFGGPEAREFFYSDRSGHTSRTYTHPTHSIPRHRAVLRSATPQIQPFSTEEAYCVVQLNLERFFGT